MRQTKFRALCLSCIICITVASCMAKSTSGTLFQNSSIESISIIRDPETGAGITRQVSVNYHQLFYTMPKNRDLIARETIRSGYSDAAEGESGEAVVDLFYRKPDQTYPATPDHTTTVSEATKVFFGSDYWSAQITGCCDAEPILQLFAFGQNKPFLYSNRQFAQVILPNARINRYVGVVLRSQIPMDDLDLAIFGKEKNAIAAILYSSPEKPLQKLMLYKAKDVSDDDLPYHTDTIKLVSLSSKDEDSYNDDPNIAKVLTMWSQDALPGKAVPSSVSGFSIIASFASNNPQPITITIPVDNDRFGKAKLTGRGLSLEAK